MRRLTGQNTHTKRHTSTYASFKVGIVLARGDFVYKVSSRKDVFHLSFRPSQLLRVVHTLLYFLKLRNKPRQPRTSFNFLQNLCIKANNVFSFRRKVIGHLKFSAQSSREKKNLLDILAAATVKSKWLVWGKQKQFSLYFFNGTHMNELV